MSYLAILKGFDPNQPRDADGKWTSGGGTEARITPGRESGHNPYDAERQSSAGAGASVYKTTDKETSVAKVLARSELTPEDIVEFEELQRKAADIWENRQTTDVLHTKNGDGKTWTKERRALHSKILNGFFKEALKNRKNFTGKPPTIKILGGRGGSGKGGLNGNVYDKRRELVIDSDEFKKMIGEATKTKSNPDGDYSGWDAARVHEESSHLFDRATRIATRLGLNMVLDVTLKTGRTSSTPFSKEKAIYAAQRRGFTSEAHFMHLSREEAAIRAANRWKGEGPGKRGRLVPLDIIIDKNTRNEKVFDGLTKQVDTWTLWHNDVPRNTQPELIKGLVAGKIVDNSDRVRLHSIRARKLYNEQLSSSLGINKRYRRKRPY